MPECQNCGKDYRVWDAPIGKGICAECYQAQGEAEAKAWDERVKWNDFETTRHISEGAQQAVPGYSGLRAIIGVYYLLAGVIGVGALLLVIVAVSQASFMLAAASLVGGMVGAVGCMAAAELIKVLLDTEENTRNCYSALRQMLKR